jgi:hypothetical protein
VRGKDSARDASVPARCRARKTARGNSGEARFPTTEAVNASHRPIAIEVQEARKIPQFGDPIVRASIYIGIRYTNHEDGHATWYGHEAPLSNRKAETKSKDRFAGFAAAENGLRDVERIAACDFGLPTKERYSPYKETLRCVYQAHPDILDNSDPLASVAKYEAEIKFDMGGLGFRNGTASEQVCCITNEATLMLGVYEPMRFEALRFYEYVWTLSIQREFGGFGTLLSGFCLSIRSSCARSGCDYVFPCDLSSSLVSPRVGRQLP